MADIQRVRAAWTGLNGLPGVSTFYTSNYTDFLPGLRAFYNSLASYIPVGCSIQVENTGDVLEDSTGVLTGQWSGTAVAAVTCSGSGVYSAPSGAVVRWLTVFIADGHRVSGKTFLVPLSSLSFQSDGTLSSAFVAAAQAAASTLVTASAGTFAVWHRPRAARAADGSRPAVTARAGASFAVSGSTVRDKAMILRSRRD